MCVHMHAYVYTCMHMYIMVNPLSLCVEVFVYGTCGEKHSLVTFGLPRTIIACTH